MKRIFTVCVLLFGLINNALGALPTGTSNRDVAIPSFWGGFTLGLTGLHWEMGTTQDEYLAQMRPPATNDTIFFSGINTYSINPESSWNFKINIGYLFPCTGNDLQFTYWNYHQSTSRSVNDLNGSITLFPILSIQWPTTTSVTINNPVLVGSPLTFEVPGIVLPGGAFSTAATNPNFANATVSRNYYAVDFDAGQYINIGCRSRIKFLAGIRYAQIKSGLDVNYIYNQVNPEGIVIPGIDGVSNITVNLGANLVEALNQKTKFNGAGPHVGIDFVYHLDWGFGLVASSAGSMLVGNTSASLNDIFTKVGIAAVTDSSIPSIPIGTLYTSTTQNHVGFNFGNTTRCIPNIDAKIGIDFTALYCNPSRTKVTLEAGYMVSYYFNAVNRMTMADIAIAQGSRGQTVDSQFSGLYFGIQIKV